MRTVVALRSRGARLLSRASDHTGIRARACGGVLALAASVALAAGCGTAAFSGEDLRFKAVGDTIYLLARSDGVSRNLCSTLGGDVTRVEGRLASADGKTVHIGRVAGCYTVRHVIVCAEGDLSCVAHEERHREEGAFHR